MILWLSKDGSTGGGVYELCIREPELLNGSYYRGGCIYTFCRIEFEKFCPSLKLRARAKCRVKLTVTKNGIKLEKL